MSNRQFIAQMKIQIRNLMGSLSVSEIVSNPGLIRQIEIVVEKLAKVS